MFLKQFAKFLAALGIVALLFVGYGYAHMRAMRRAWYWGIGAELIKTTNSTRLVAVGPGLHSKLSEFLSSPAAVAQVAHGDTAPPIGDGTATAQIILTNARGERLGIRLRRDDAISEFQGASNYHVAGFWTPDPK